MNGGILVQNCERHARFGTHSIANEDGTKMMEITSTHHQMQYPFNLGRKDYNILWRAESRLSRFYEGLSDGDSMPPVEPEIVKYHVKGKPLSLAIQGHPEMMRKSSPTIVELNNLIKSCLQEIK